MLLKFRSGQPLSSWQGRRDQARDRDRGRPLRLTRHSGLSTECVSCKSEHVLSRIAPEYQRLQYSFIAGIDDVCLLRLVCFFLQRDKLTLNLCFRRVLRPELLEHHYMRVAFHCVQNLILTTGKKHITYPHGVVESNLAGVRHAILILLRAQEQTRPENANRNQNHDL